jgi:hypothetical protein
MRSFFKNLFNTHPKSKTTVSKSQGQQYNSTLVTQIHSSLTNLPIDKSILEHLDSYQRSHIMNINQAIDFLLQSVNMEGWHISDASNNKCLETGYMGGSGGHTYRYFRVWRTAENTYVGNHNLYEDY